MLSHLGCVCLGVCSGWDGVHWLGGGGVSGVGCCSSLGKGCLSYSAGLDGVMGVARSLGQLLCFES